MLYINEVNAQNSPVVYECVCFKDNTDIHVPMYLTPEDFEYMGEDEVEKPTISCEYSYSIGNSNGGFNLIWKVFNKYPNVQGGFVWDWVDKGLLETGKMVKNIGHMVVIMVKNVH